MDTEKFWTTTEMNKFLYQQLKAICEAEGFVLSPRRGKRMVRIAEHYTEVVYPEIVYARTVVHVSLFSSASLRITVTLTKIFTRKEVMSVFLSTLMSILQ